MKPNHFRDAACCICNAAAARLLRRTRLAAPAQYALRLRLCASAPAGQLRAYAFAAPAISACLPQAGRRLNTPSRRGYFGLPAAGRPTPQYAFAARLFRLACRRQADASIRLRGAAISACLPQAGRRLNTPSRRGYFGLPAAGRPTPQYAFAARLFRLACRRQADASIRPRFAACNTIPVPCANTAETSNIKSADDCPKKTKQHPCA